MQATELMPGDWVVIQKRIERVNYLSIIDDNPKAPCWSVNGTHNPTLIKPLKLTDKILKLSNFIELPNVEDETFVNGSIILVKEEEGWRLNWGASFELCINYVHELQHISSLLQLDLTINTSANGTK